MMQRQAWLRTGQTELAVQARRPASRCAHLARVGARRTWRATSTARWPRCTCATTAARCAASAAYGFDRESEQREQVLRPAPRRWSARPPAKTARWRSTNVPGDYVKVASGLGRARRATCWWRRSRTRARSTACIEIGFLHPARKRDVEFLQLVGDGIGAAVAAALYRQRLQDALAETQQLNEELQVQQEELRTANEELEEQSRVLEESQAQPGKPAGRTGADQRPAGRAGAERWTRRTPR